jgi:C4-dicarboxylate-specific signal transduction histidine kinase
MRRWGISENRLPPGSEIYFRQSTAWEQYRGLILAFCAALLLQGGLIAWLIYEHRRRHIAEVASRNSIAELAHMNRIATAGELSASIAHEVNQPLAAIGVYAHAALNWLKPERLNLNEVRTALTQVSTASLQAGEIIKNLRALFTKDTQNKGPVDVNKVISAVLALVGMEARKHNIEIRMQLDPRLPTVSGVEIQLQQVILNLVMNAIEAMQSVQSGPRELNVRSELSDSDGVRVSIEDTGHGILPSDVPRVFEPMFTTKARGMGVGLSICRSIIEGHKGRIWVTPGHRGGSTFQFVLPRG